MIEFIEIFDEKKHFFTVQTYVHCWVLDQGKKFPDGLSAKEMLFKIYEEGREKTT